MAWSYFSFSRSGLRFSGACAQREGKSKGGWPLECARLLQPCTLVRGQERLLPFQFAADFQLAPDDLKPRITCGIEWELSSVLDLTVADLPAWLKLSNWMRENFTKINDSGFETICQAFGRAARNSGVAGILCPSVRVKGGINLVVFRDRMRKAEVARVLGEAELKKYLAWTHAILHAIIIDEDAQ